MPDSPATVKFKVSRMPGRSDHDLLKLFLDKHGLLSSEFVYRGFAKGRIGIVLATGTDRDETSQRHFEEDTAGLKPQDYLCAIPLGESQIYAAVSKLAHVFVGALFGWESAMPPGISRNLKAVCSGNLDWAVNSAFFDGINALSIYRLDELRRIDCGDKLYAAKASFLEALVKVVIPVVDSSRYSQASKHPDSSLPAHAPQ